MQDVRTGARVRNNRWEVAVVSEHILKDDRVDTAIPGSVAMGKFRVGRPVRASDEIELAVLVGPLKSG